MAVSGAGRLDRRISILRAVTAPNAFNEPETTWNVLTTVWANRHDASAFERYRAVEIGAEITARFTVRYSPAIATVDPKDRVRFDGQDYDIVGVRDVNRHQWREIDCVTRADKDLT